MNDITAGLEGLKLVVAIGLVVAAYVFVWRRSRLDLYRDDLFHIRDALFLQMAKLGELQHPAHRHVRAQLNALIKVAPTTNIWVVTFTRMMASKLPDPPPPPQFPSNPDAAHALRDARSKMLRRLVRHVLLGSMPALVLTAVGLPILLLVIVANRAFSSMERHTQIRPWGTLKRRVREAAEYASYEAQEAASFEPRKTTHGKTRAVCA